MNHQQNITKLQCSAESKSLGLADMQTEVHRAVGLFNAPIDLGYKGDNVDFQTRQTSRKACWDAGFGSLYSRIMC